MTRYPSWDELDAFRYEREALIASIGRWNVEQGHGWEGPAGSVVKAIVISDPNFCTFTARFPYQDDALGTAGDISIDRVVDYRQKRSLGGSISFHAKSEPYGHDPQLYAAAIDAIVLPGITLGWTFYEIPRFEGHYRTNFNWEFTQGPPALDQLDHSNSLELTGMQLYDLNAGAAIEVWTLQHLTVNPIVVYSGMWSSVAYVCSQGAWTDGNFKYILANTLR